MYFGAKIQIFNKISNIFFPPKFKWDIFWNFYFTILARKFNWNIFGNSCIEFWRENSKITNDKNKIVDLFIPWYEQKLIPQPIILIRLILCWVQSWECWIGSSGELKSWTVPAVFNPTTATASISTRPPLGKAAT